MQSKFENYAHEAWQKAIYEDLGGEVLLGTKDNVSVYASKETVTKRCFIQRVTEAIEKAVREALVR